MNAILKPVQKTLYQQQLENVLHYGAPGAHLEANEVPQWVDELGADMTSQTIEALNSHADDKQLEQFGRLMTACMCDITADHLVELRDLIRSIVLDYSIAQMQRMIDAEIGP